MPDLDLTEAIEAALDSARNDLDRLDRLDIGRSYDEIMHLTTRAARAAAPLVEKAVREQVVDQLREFEGEQRKEAEYWDRKADDGFAAPEEAEYRRRMRDHHDTVAGALDNAARALEPGDPQVTATDPPASIGRTGANREESP